MTNFTTLLTPTQSNSKRGPGRPLQCEIERLRAAITFTELKRVSGLKLSALHRQFAEQTPSYSSETHSWSTPVAFLRYGRGMQVPKPTIYEWLRREWPDVYRTSQSPFFRALTVPSEREALTEFAAELYGNSGGGLPRDVILNSLSKVALSTGLRFRTPIWLQPRDVVRLVNRPEIDALCLIIHCLKVNEGTDLELDCAKVAAAWLQKWATGKHIHEDAKALLISVLRDRVSGLQELLAVHSQWQAIEIDLNAECYKQAPEIRFMPLLRIPG